MFVSEPRVRSVETGHWRDITGFSVRRDGISVERGPLQTDVTKLTAQLRLAVSHDLVPAENVMLDVGRAADVDAVESAVSVESTQSA